ncbi:hypothetical protein [Vibrio sp.]
MSHELGSALLGQMIAEQAMQKAMYGKTKKNKSLGKTLWKKLAK